MQPVDRGGPAEAAQPRRRRRPVSPDPRCTETGKWRFRWRKASSEAADDAPDDVKPVDASGSRPLMPRGETPGRHDGGGGATGDAAVPGAAVDAPDAEETKGE